MIRPIQKDTVIRTIKARKRQFDPHAVEKSTLGVDGRLAGRFNNLVLRSVYQPVFNVVQKQVAGYEALVRPVEKGTPVPADELFRAPRAEAETVFLDRLARYIHVSNFLTLGDRDGLLFLNVSPVAIIRGPAYGTFFQGLLDRFGMPPERVVIEVGENPTAETEGARLSDAVNYYRDLGCLVALDDFGAGHSNFERIWSLKPDIVKVARSMLTRAGDLSDRENILQGIVGLLQQSGSQVVLEGVETEADAYRALASGADFVQGRYFASPSEEPLTGLEEASLLFDSLLERRGSGSGIVERRTTLHPGSAAG